MPKKYIFYALAYSGVVAAALMPELSKATDFGIEPRLTTGVMYYEFRQKPDVRNDPTSSGSTFSGNTGFSLKDTMPFIQGGLTFSANRFYLDFYAQTAFSGEDSDSIKSLSFSGATQTSRTTPVNAEWDRQEYSITAGMRATDYMTFFVGYRQATTEFDFKNPSFFSPGTIFLSKTDFEQSGPFLGVNLATDVGDTGPLAGVLSVNAAVGFMEAELDSTPNTTVLPTGEVIPPSGQDGGNFLTFGPPDGKIEGDSVGITIGIGWRGDIPQVKELSYTLSANYYKYDYSTSSSDVGWDFQEQTVKLSVGVSYAFL